MLDHVGVDLFKADEWHDKVGKYPMLLSEVCASPRVFSSIGPQAQDSVVAGLIERSAADVRALSHLERLKDVEALSERQTQRFRRAVSKLGLAQVSSSNLRTATCFGLLISALSSHDWNFQNPAAAVLAKNGGEQAAELTDQQQEELGRNLLQAAEGSSRGAFALLKMLNEKADSWPVGVMRGIFLESFTNEDDGIRFKTWRIDYVLGAMEHLEDTARDEIVVLATNSVVRGSPKHPIDQTELSEVTEALQQRTWCNPLVVALSAKFAAR
jgi:hypothetical protein